MWMIRILCIIIVGCLYSAHECSWMEMYIYIMSPQNDTKCWTLLRWTFCNYWVCHQSFLSFYSDGEDSVVSAHSCVIMTTCVCWSTCSGYTKASDEVDAESGSHCHSAYFVLFIGANLNNPHSSKMSTRVPAWCDHEIIIYLICKLK